MRLKPYLQLIRLPNVFTAAADSLAGWLLATGSFAQPQSWLPLTLASACIYAGGIALNDVFDTEVDRKERPGRPIPSGRVSRKVASWLGWGLLAAGLLLAFLSGARLAVPVAVALVACVLLYDGVLKRSVLGPEVMGACRGLNFLLGMSGAANFGGPACVAAAVAYATFVVGVTWISRSEVETGRRHTTVLGSVLQNLAFLGLIAVALGLIPDSPPRDRQAIQALTGSLALAALALAVNWRALAAWRTPTPATLQRAVKFSILSLVWLHVGLLLAARGPIPAVAVALFWIPAAFTGRWIYST